MKIKHLLVPALLLAAASCKSNKEEDANPSTSNGDFMTWTQDGTTYTATDVSAFTYQTLPQIAVNGGVVRAGQSMSERTITLSIPNTITGPGTYPMPQSTNPAATAYGQLVWLTSGSSTPRAFNTTAGPAAANGTLVLTEYDRAAQRVAGTFQFTAKAYDTGTPQTVTIASGSFRLTKLQAAPGGL